MVVKNDGATIQNFLSEIAPLVDAICICDVGSEDSTVEIIESFLQEKKIPGMVYRHAWKDFGYNKTLSVNASIEFLSKNGSLLDSWYLLSLDSNMRLNKKNEFSKNDLHADAYILEQVTGDITHQNIFLIKACLPWECIGAAYAYWNSSQAKNIQLLPTLWIDVIEEENHKKAALEQNIRLLSEGLQKEPENPRYIFYLAQSYMGLLQFDEAISWYKERIKIPEGFEENWYSHYMLGECFKKKNNFQEALSWYLKAYEIDPLRAEPLAKIAECYIEQKNYTLCLMFAKQASSMPRPKDHAFFIEESFYSFFPDQLASIAGYYTAFGRQDGQKAADHLILGRKTPQQNRELAYANMEFYSQPLAEMKKIPLSIRLPETIPGSSITYRPCNPSIQKTEDGYVVLLRTVNYGIGPESYSLLNPKEKFFNSKNFLLKLSKDFSILSSKEIIDTTNRKRISVIGITGLEDCRLFSLDSKKNPQYCTCTTVDTDPSGVPETSLLYFTEKETTIDVEKVVPLHRKDPMRWEKNWLPFMEGRKMHVVYSYDPFTIYAIDPETGNTQEVIKYTPEGNFSNFRGSAGPIPFDEGYLIIVHEVSRFSSWQRKNYLHRFIYLNKDFKVCKISPPFTLCHLGIEFCCGMTLDHDNEHVILGFGVEDQEAYLGLVKIATIQSMLYEHS